MLQHKMFETFCSCWKKLSICQSSHWSKVKGVWIVFIYLVWLFTELPPAVMTDSSLSIFTANLHQRCGSQIKYGAYGMFDVMALSYDTLENQWCLMLLMSNLRHGCQTQIESHSGGEYYQWIFTFRSYELLFELFKKTCVYSCLLCSVLLVCILEPIPYWEKAWAAMGRANCAHNTLIYIFMN